MTKKKIKDKVREDTYTEKLEKKLAESNKRNKQLLTALKTAKKLIRDWYITSEYKRGSFKAYQSNPEMQRINKAIKND